MIFYDLYDIIYLHEREEIQDMARKKIEPIVSLGNEDKLIIQKSRPLFSLWQSDLTLAEFKILDTYLGRIDSHKPNKRLVTFEKGELEEKLGIKKLNKADLELRLKHLMGNVVKITDEDEKKGFRLITLFEEAEAEQDESGQWKINLECTQKAMKYIFNIENLGYLRYKLRCITSLTSRYTYIMFVYLESHRKLGLTWEVSVEELKKILSCDKEDTYKEYKRFNDLILKKVHKEIHEKTECQYSYEPVKKGRNVVAISFTLQSQAVLKDIEPNQYTLDDWQHDEEQKKRDEICFGFSNAEFDDFSLTELDLLKDLAQGKVKENEVQQHQDLGLTTAYQFATSEYLRKKIKMAKLKKPKNLFLYVKKMIEND